MDIAFDARQKILEIHLQGKANKESVVNSHKSDTQNIEDTPKDDTLRDIINNLEGGFPNITTNLDTFDLKADQIVSVEKEIRLNEDFSQDLTLTEKDTQGSSSAQNHKDDHDGQIETYRTPPKSKYEELYKRACLSPKKLKMMVAMFQLYSMFQSKNAYDFSTLIKIWSVFNHQQLQ